MRTTVHCHPGADVRRRATSLSASGVRGLAVPRRGPNRLPEPIARSVAVIHQLLHRFPTRFSRAPSYRSQKLVMSNTRFPT